MDTVSPKIKLSALWVFVLLNIVFRDIHQMTMKSHLEMLLTGYYHGMEVTDTIMLFGGIVLEIPLAMIVLSLFLKQKHNRIANIAAVVITILLTSVELPSDMDDYFFRLVEFIGFATIFLISWRWKTTPEQATAQSLN